MKKLNIILGTKGGIGKSTIALNLCMVAAFRGLDFEYLELDSSNNTSKSLINSEVFKNRMTSCKVSNAQEELFKATFKALKEEKIVFIDVGGGLDSVSLITLIKEEFSHHQLNFILPFENSVKQMDNLINTYNYIDRPEDVFLVKNKVIDEDDPYRFFEGDKHLGVKSIRKELSPVNKVFQVYLSDSQQFPEITKQCMLDLSQLAIQYNRKEAEEVFMQDAKDMNEYKILMQNYSKSVNCLKEIKTLNNEFEELFDE